MEQGSRLVAVALLALAGAWACTSDSTDIVVTTNEPPQPEFTVAPQTPSINELATFDASASTDPDGRIVAFGWDVDGDTIYEVEGQDTVILHRYATAGDRTVVLRAVDEAGDTATTTQVVTVLSNNAPFAGFTFSPTDPIVTEAVTFDAAGSSDPDGTIVEYRWDFDGDGTIDQVDTTPTTTYSFDDPGDYIVLLEVVDDDGARESAVRTVAVSSN
ncbi:MAG: PKD domain-containing protein [Longimicrobiales bacterium]|nr:PKD domain-containing protein [Longimicrobiales bacterium]